ncbi:MAG: UDP-N-acetylmuramate--L-alanine ligase [Candidatus Alcyoniella australis]|nr:UDP-N-acetylmuramate--L-alanine ligase [Candidatus Alcyoniella australis]
MFGRARRIHFVGIGGIGMSGIAEVLLNLGYEVTGSDMRRSDVTHRLQTLGGKVGLGHDPEAVRGADVIVISSAVGPDNPEVQAAQRLGIPVIPRAEMLAELMRMKYGVAVAGTHGKTTTTSMIATVLRFAGLDPTVVIGGRLESIGSNARLGQGPNLVAEADESDGSFILLSPTVAVVTNIDREHMNHYRDLDQLLETFVGFINKVPFYGQAILCVDSPLVRKILPQVKKRYATYAVNEPADLTAVDIEIKEHNTTFEVHDAERGRLGRVRLGMPGKHHVANALATLAVAAELNVPFEAASEGLRDFGGVGRRFDIRGEAAGITIVDDYAHHPAEISGTLEAAAEGYGRPIRALFQPHRYSRVADLLDEFAQAFDAAATVVVMPIYAAGEQPLEGISADALARRLREHGHPDVLVADDHSHAVELMVGRAGRGDVLFTLGAGDVTKLADILLDSLRRREEGR